MAKRLAKARPKVPEELKGQMRARTKAKTEADAALKAGMLEASTAKVWGKSNWETWLDRFIAAVPNNYGRVTKAQLDTLVNNEFDNKLVARARQVRGLTQRRGAFI